MDDRPEAGMEEATAAPPHGGAPSSSKKGPVFPLSKIKSLLQRNEGVGIVTQPSLELVGAASAAMIKSLVEAAVRHKKKKKKSDPAAETEENSDGKNDSGPVDDDNGQTLVTLADLRHAASADEERFRFLADALNGPEATEALQREDDRAPKKPRRARKKRQRGADAHNVSVDPVATLPPGRIKDPPPSAPQVHGGVTNSKTVEKAAGGKGDGSDNQGLGEGSALRFASGADVPLVTETRKPAIEVDEEEYD
jgi:hypothetical protein